MLGWANSKPWSSLALPHSHCQGKLSCPAQARSSSATDRKEQSHRSCSHAIRIISTLWLRQGTRSPHPCAAEGEGQGQLSCSHDSGSISLFCHRWQGAHVEVGILFFSYFTAQQTRCRDSLPMFIPSGWFTSNTHKQRGTTLLSFQGHVPVLPSWLGTRWALLLLTPQVQHSHYVHVSSRPSSAQITYINVSIINSPDQGRVPGLWWQLHGHRPRHGPWPQHRPRFHHGRRWASLPWSLSNIFLHCAHILLLLFLFGFSTFYLHLFVASWGLCLGSSLKWTQEFYIPPIPYDDRQGSSQAWSAPPPALCGATLVVILGSLLVWVPVAPSWWYFRSPCAGLLLGAHSLLGPWFQAGFFSLLFKRQKKIWSWRSVCSRRPGKRWGFKKTMWGKDDVVWNSKSIIFKRENMSWELNIGMSTLIYTKLNLYLTLLIFCFSFSKFNSRRIFNKKLYL
jgi:hypothetical protein